MADYLTPSPDEDPLDGINTYESTEANESINGADGQNTIVYEVGDGVDSITFAAPRTYQFAGFLDAANAALAADFGGDPYAYSNEYFSTVDSSLFTRLPPGISSVLYSLQGGYWGDDGGFVPGVVDSASAEAAFNQLVAWITAPVTNTIRFGPGVSLTNLTVQLGEPTTNFGVPSTFGVAVNGQAGLVFHMLPPDAAAGAVPPPPPIDIVFEFTDEEGNVTDTATLADVLGAESDGVAGLQYGAETDETLVGSLADDQIYGNGGDDRIIGRAGSDGLYGGAGNDVISGGAGMDIIFGDDGDDVIAAGRDGAFVSGGSGNDVYLFNAGDGALFVDNAPGMAAGEVDTLSFGGGITPDNVMAYIDASGTLNLFVPGSSDQVLLTWYMDNFDGTYSLRDDQAVANAQFVDSAGNVRVFDLAGLVAANQAALFGATLEAPIPLFGLGSHEVTGTVAPAGGEYAINYSNTGEVLESSAPSGGNHAPVAGAALGNQTFKEGDSIDVSLPAGAFSDPDGDTLTYSASLADGSMLPTWLQFNSATRSFSGTPDDAQVGTLNIMVTASDGQASASQTFELTVTNVNDTPTVADAVGDQSIDEDSSFTMDLSGMFADADGDSLALSVDAPAWMTFENGVLSGTPGNAEVGSHAVTVTATDPSGASVQHAFNVHVDNVNDAPIVVNAMDDLNVDEDSDIAIDVSGVFGDVDLGDSLSVSADAPAWLTYSNGELSGTPGNAEVGTHSVTLTATDAAGASVQHTFDITVNNVNDAPIVVAPIGDHSTEEGSDVSFDVSGVFADIDLGDSLSLSVDAPAWLTYSDGVLSGTAEAGTYSVTLTATDAAGESAQQTFSIAVSDLNDAPIVVNPIGDLTVDEDSDIAIDVSNVFGDVDLGDSLSLSADAPAWLTLSGGELWGTASNADVGTYSVTLTATDRAGESVQHTFGITVNNVNDAPTVVNAVADQSVNEDAPVTIDLRNVFGDIDPGDSLSLSVSAPSWLTFSNGVLSGTPGNAEVGTHAVTVTATDTAGESAQQTFSIAVANTNDAPVLVHAIADQTAKAGQMFKMTLPANAFSDVDVGDSLTYSVRMLDGSALPSWLTYDANTRTLSGTPTGVPANARVSLQLQVVATDRAGATASDSFALSVDGVVAPPPPAAGRDLRGGKGNDRLTGGAGNDTLNGKGGRDVLDGGAGNDTLYFHADGKWGKSNDKRTNVGSPSERGSGAKVSIRGMLQSQDIFIGGAGIDTLVGTSCDDAILLDDTKSGAQSSGPRLSGIEIINAGAGNDLVDLTSTRYAYGNVTIDGGSGNDVLWASEGHDVLRGGSGNDYLDGGAGRDYLDGGSGNDKLYGGRWEDILQGGSGDDLLSDSSPSSSNLLDGGTGNDVLEDSTGNTLFIGGRGDDKIKLGGGKDIIAYNKGDGRDTVVAGNGGQATLSLGGGIKLQDLVFRRSGDNLLLETGSGGTITFERWYKGRDYQAVSTLQFVTDGVTGGGSLFNQEVEIFDFKKLVGAFDTARSRNSGLSKWALVNGLASFDLGGSNTEAIGGDLAYTYATAGSLAGIAVGAAQDILSSGSFGSKQAALRPRSELTSGALKLV